MDTRTIGRTVVCTFFAFVTAQALGAVGRTQGNADVSQTGEASYSIPIFAPPGTHGMTPQLALVYGQRSGSTLVGAGWSIAGLSAISRCPKIWAADGEARDVRNDRQDRYCLDRNKLRLTSGTYSNWNATYQTEIETFSRITSLGSVGNGPTNFVVEGKDGLMYEYGNTANSRIESVGQATVRTWALNQVRDRSGNAINFVYAEDTTNGSYRIDSVTYTSNPAQGLSSAYEIDFVWEIKPANEIDSGYIAGSQVKEITRLDRVDVKYNVTTLVRRYELTYEGALSSTSKSRLASVQECAGASPDCFSPTTFSYQNGTSGLNAEVSTGASATTTPWPMDVNGDGREDLVYSSHPTSGSGTWMVMFANSSGGYNAPINTGVTNTNYLGAIPIDYNADGLADLLVPYSGGTWWVMIGSASGLAAPINTGAPATATGTGTNARAFDVNGDGLDDLVWADLVGYAGGDAVRYRARELAGTFSSTAIALVGPFPADMIIETGVFGQVGRPGPKLVPDFNGDGRGDFTFRRNFRSWNSGTGQYDLFPSIVVTSSGSWTYGIANPSTAGTPTFGDFNGDGKSDLLYLDQSGTLVARFSTGSMVGLPYAVGGGSAGWAILDWDSDGNDDILIVSGGNWHWKRATGDGFVASYTNTGLAATGRTVTDINGDGLYDLAGIAGYRTHPGSYPDLMHTATDAFGNSSTFSYTSIVQGTYTKNSGAVYPEVEYQGPLQVVSSVVSNDGIGGAFTQSFWYYYARLNLQGRGFEGFHSRRTIDSRNGIQLFEERAQAFPYTGMLQETVALQPSGTEIRRATNTLQTHSYGAGFESRSLPFMSHVNASEREVGGTYNGNVIRTTVQQILVDSATGTPYDTITTVTEPVTGANGVQAGATYVQRVYSPTAFFSDTPSTWCRGRPGQTQQINYHNQFGGGAITRTTDLTWDMTACRPTQVVEESGHAQLQVTRTIGYDGFGNVNSDAVTGIGMTARTTTANWGTTGQFPTSVTNALSQTTSKTWNYAFGTQTSETDPNGIAISWLYDEFGRRRQENRADGTYTTFGYYHDPACDPRARYYVLARSRTSTGAIVLDHYVFFDQLERPIDEYRSSFSTASWDTKIRTYDTLGRVATVGAPYNSGGCTSYASPYVASLQYDLLSRPTQVSRPTSDSNPTLQTTTSYYEALTTRVVDPLGKQTTKIANVVGGVARSTDHDGYYQTFDYDGFRNIARVTDSLSNTLQSNTFNIRGIRTAQADMDAGTWSFTPNALGEITVSDWVSTSLPTPGFCGDGGRSVGDLSR